MRIRYRFTYLHARVGIAALLLLIAARSRFTLPLPPACDFDSPNYLWPALLKLNGGEFTHTAGLNFLYPGFLFLVLRLAGDFRVITVIQHLLGLAAVVFFLLAWSRLRELLPAPRVHRVVYDAVGLFGAGVYLFSPTPVVLEMLIRPEAVCMFFESASIWAALSCFCFGLVRPDGRKALISGVGAIAGAMILLSLKPSYTVTSLLVISAVSAVMLRRAERLTFAVASTAVVLLLLVPEWWLARRDPLSTSFLPKTLFAVHAKIIRNQMAEDVAAKAGRYPHEWLQHATSELGVEIERTRQLYPRQFTTLGFHPDYLMNGEDAIFDRWSTKLGGEEVLLGFLRHYYWRTLRHRPTEFAKKIGDQLRVFYTTPNPAFRLQKRVRLGSSVYATSGEAIARDLREQLANVRGGAEYMALSAQLVGTNLVLMQGDWLRRFNTALAHVYLPSVVVTVPIALWLLVRRGTTAESKCAAAAVLFLLGLNFGNVLAISVVHSMEVPRYSTVKFLGVLLAELFALVWLAELCLKRVRQLSVE